MTTDLEHELWPDVAIPPGETLRDELEARRTTQRELALKTNTSVRTISDIVRGRRGISPDMALALEDAFDGISARFWMNLQTDYELTLARLRRRDRTA